MPCGIQCLRRIGRRCVCQCPATDMPCPAQKSARKADRLSHSVDTTHPQKVRPGFACPLYQTTPGEYLNTHLYFNTRFTNCQEIQKDSFCAFYARTRPTIFDFPPLFHTFSPIGVHFTHTAPGVFNPACLRVREALHFLGVCSRFFSFSCTFAILSVSLTFLGISQFPSPPQKLLRFCARCTFS